MKEIGMPAYMLAFVRIHDIEAHQQQYMAHAHPILVKHGGKALAVTEEVIALEGRIPQGRTVLVEFPSLQHAQAFYDDPEYQPFKAIRQNFSDSDSIIFDAGLVVPAA